MNRYTDDMKLWLFDLAHGNLSDKDVLSGFICYYVLSDGSISDVQRDIVFHTSYGIDDTEFALGSLNRVLELVSL